MTERGRDKVWKKTKRIVNEQFIIKKKKKKGKSAGQWKKTGGKEKKLGHCWTQHIEKKKRKERTFFRKIDST